MKLGGFVIHGNDVDTLGACLDSLTRLCDETIAVDSESNDGSAQLVDARGVRRIVHPWEGYGAARAVAASALADSDYLFFLDADERLAEGDVERLREWRAGLHEHPYWRLDLRDWVELPGHRFLFRVGCPARIVRRDLAAWSREMVVHESLPWSDAGIAPGRIEHRYLTSFEGLEEKQDRYALLWAAGALLEGRRAKSAVVQRAYHFLRVLLFQGALFRGGVDAVRAAWAAARYNAMKQRYLSALRRGEHAEFVARMRAGEYREVFAALS